LKEAAKSHERLVPVGLDSYEPYTSGLSTS